MSHAFQTRVKNIIEAHPLAAGDGAGPAVSRILTAADDGIDAVIQLLWSSDPTSTTLVCWALGRLEDKTAVPALTKLAADPGLDSLIRRASMAALSFLETRQSTETLLRLLKQDLDSSVRYEAAQSLALHSGDEARSGLEATLLDHNEQIHIRARAAEALGSMRDQAAIPVLIQALSDSDPNVRYWSTYALTQLGDSRALPELQRVLETDDTIIPEEGSIKTLAQLAIDRILGN